MKIGDVFRWSDYPKQKDGNLKARWFVYLGLSSILSNPQNVFLLPATSQTDLYKSGCRRQNHKNIMKFANGDCGFEEETIVDLNFFENNWVLKEFNNYIDNMTTKGSIPNNQLKQIYDLVLNSSEYIERIIIIDIRRNLNNIGIFNLKMPR
ncbi:MAG: hypothetical protein ACYDIA_25995 [Candidatus Humimicrobiaceae bacterium]